MMALCRIYLCTYRRPTLLPRALQSLLQQTCQDWVCELHNDDPTDPTPGALVDAINDPRITLVNHAKNLGPTQTFNLVFQRVEEPFVSLLEDDNWWQPNFLETMLQAMEQYPQVDVAWSNMRMWQENENGSWTDLQKSTFPLAIKERSKLFDWSHSYQVLGALHSQGAMLVRAKNIEQYQVPSSTPSAGIEHVRERAYAYPILFVNQELANFAVTRSTSRSKNRALWAQVQTLLTASFLKHASVTEPKLSQLWTAARSGPAKSTGTLFFAALICPECRFSLRYATLADWLFFLGCSLKRPVVAWKTLQSIHAFPDLWQFLDRQTALRFQELQHQSPDIKAVPSVTKI